MNKVVIKWLPLFIMLSTMCMPFLLNMVPLPKLVIPSLFIVWVSFVSYQYGIQVNKHILILFSLLLLSQLYLVLTNDIGIASYTLLGVLWFSIAIVIWGGMASVRHYANTYYKSFLFAAMLWLVVSAIVWMGWTDNQAIKFGMFAMTQNAQPKPAGPFANGNVFGILMVCGWLISSYFWLRKEKLLSINGALAFVFLVWVFVSMSRGAWVACLPLFITVVFWLGYKKQWVMVLFVFTSAMVAWFLASALVYYFTETADLSSRAESMLSGFSVRSVLYPSVFEVWKEHWVLGVGLGNLGGHYLTGQALALSYLPEHLSGERATTIAHNHLLQVLSEAGIIGFMLWSVVTYYLFKGLWLCRFNLQSSAWLPLNLALALWIQGLFNISMVEPIPFFLFFFFLGLGYSFINEKKMRQGLFIPPKMLILTSALVVPLLFYQSVKVTTNWTLYNNMLNTSDGPSRGKIISELMNYEDTYPVLIQQIASDMLDTENQKKELMSLQPYIIDALKKEERAGLYQALFYTYVLQDKWEKACSLGYFLKQQRWRSDINEESYNNSCLAKTTERFKLSR